jgi:capsular polysaccharide biosynthesis protein
MELRNYLRIFVRKLWIILPVFLLTLAATVFYTSQQRPVYTARTTFIARLNRNFIDNKSDASALDILSRRTEIATTFSEVAKSRRIKFYAGEQLGLSIEQRKFLSVDSRLVAGTNIIEISTEGPNPDLVTDFTNALGTVTIEYVNNLYEAFELVPLDEAITPTSPSRPKKTFNYLLGAVVGLSLGLGLAFLAESLSIKDEPDKKEHSREKADTLERADYPSQWQQELAVLKAQFEVTREQMEQTQMMLRSTQHNVDAANTTVRAFTNWLESYRTDMTEKNGSNNGAGDNG